MNETEERGLVVAQTSAEMQRFLPVMSLSVAVERRQMIVEAVKMLMTKDEDYGVIPGTKKNTLLQPGADKLNNLFGLVPRFMITEQVLDWTGVDHSGEPFFYFEVKCQLWRGDFLMGEGDGSANSWETRYRFRKAERVCPECGMDAIIKGKAEWGGGWICFKKKNGCGSKFADDDPAITEQVVGNVANPGIHDLVNSIRKIANKRAKIAATLNATSAHEFFTQDIEDLPAEIFGDQTQREPQQERATRQQPSKPEMDIRNTSELPWRVNVPQELIKLYDRCATSKQFVDVMAEFRDQIIKSGGEHKDYMDVLSRNNIKERSDVGKMILGQREKLAYDLYFAVDALRKSSHGVSHEDISDANESFEDDLAIDGDEIMREAFETLGGDQGARK